MVKRTETEIMVDIRRVYGDLSPENLACDGELPLYLIRQRYAKLNRTLAKLEKELGRTVDESEVYGIF